jgi:hypothetical protein
MIPGIALVYYMLPYFNFKSPLYAYYLLCTMSFAYHAYKGLSKTQKYTNSLLKLDIACQQIMIYACIFASPFQTQIVMMMPPLTIICLGLCNYNILIEQYLALYSHALCLLSTACILDYKIMLMWIVAMIIFSKKAIYPKSAGTIWHAFNHVCTYYTWFALEKMT